MGFLKSVGKFALEALEDRADSLSRSTKYDELRDQYSEMGNGFRAIKNNFFEDDDCDDNYDYDDDDY
ncbi:hypothetical protein [Intestinibacter sp.]|uniref:hypothetical protein n=1 Tax=Intestinibacter sp. TaxID=1965304 RepID=UPI003F1568E9